jgi:hypothetical protein
VATLTREELSKRDLFERHFNRFFGVPGEVWVFKRPKKPKVFWTIVKVENDCEKITWTQGGNTPNYIQLSAEVKDNTGQTKKQIVWTCENKIRQYHGGKGK